MKRKHSSSSSSSASSAGPGLLSRAPSLWRMGSLFEQQLMEGGAAELPMGTLQRLNSVHDINEQLLRESSDFADFRVEYYPARHGLSVSTRSRE